MNKIKNFIILVILGLVLEMTVSCNSSYDHLLGIRLTTENQKNILAYLILDCLRNKPCKSTTPWMGIKPPERNSIMSVTYGKGLFIAVAESGTNRVITSPDGITWTGRSAAEANSWRSVTFAKTNSSLLQLVEQVTTVS